MGQYKTVDADRYSRPVLHFGSYNYAGLNGHPRVLAAAEAALRQYGTTTSGVRLFNGTSELHMELEERLAAFLGFEACITFSSGYAANLSTLSLLCGPDDAVLSDMFNHQSTRSWMNSPKFSSGCGETRQRCVTASSHWDWTA